MAERTSIWRALRWDIILLLCVALGLMSYNIIKAPFFQHASQKRSEGSRPPDRTEGDVLLLLPDGPAAEATQFSELDCSYGWFNSLWQEYGSFATALTRNLSPEILAGRSVVIIPRRVAHAMPSNGISALMHFVRQGGQIILEQPPTGWEALTQVPILSKPRQAQHITSSEGLGVHGPLRKHLPNIPLTGQLYAAARQPSYPNGPTLLEVDGQPGYLVHQLGLGRVFTVLFDFGCTITAMQQGLPTRGMSFAPEQYAGPMTTSVRVADKSLLTAKTPYADMLERAILLPLTEIRPLPKLWPFPGKHAGALMIVHPTPENMRAALGFADWSRRQEGTSTIMAASDRLTPTQVALVQEAQADLGLLWVQGIKREPTRRVVGLGAIRPFAKELNLNEQVEQLLTLLPENTPVLLARTEASAWEPGFSTTFGQMAQARIRLDNSFGPTERDQYGYLFGTSYPFYPLDERGLPLPILEQPFVLHEGSLTLDRLRQFLGNSQAYFHQPIVLSLPSNAMREQPGAGILLALREAHSLARHYNHWITTLGEFLDFLSVRRQSVLTSQWSPEQRRLTISVNILASRSRTISQSVYPGIAFPRTYKSEEVDRVLVDGKEIALKLLATSGPSTERILDVEPGRHTISVFYRNPNALPPLPTP